VATILNCTTDPVPQNQLWLLFPSRDEELSFFYQINSRKSRIISSINFTQGRFANLEIFSFVIGIGIEAQHFCLKLKELIDSKIIQSPWLVLLAGFAGGCKFEQKSGDLFLVGKLMTNSQTLSFSSIFSFSPNFLEKNRIKTGFCATVGEIAGPENKIKLAVLGVDLVEMELNLVQPVFFNLKVNLICLRTILDEWDYSIPEELVSCINRGRLQFMALFYLILGKPWLLFSLMHLYSRSLIAKKKLGAGLHLIINECNKQNR